MRFMLLMVQVGASLSFVYPLPTDLWYRQRVFPPIAYSQGNREDTTVILQGCGGDQTGESDSAAGLMHSLADFGPGIKRATTAP